MSEYMEKHAVARLIQCLYTPRHRCFNQFAAPGGCLHAEVWPKRRPLLIDRGCGGISYENYPFDRRLLDAYAGRRVNLVLETDPGSAGNTDADRGGWGTPWLMSGTLEAPDAAR